MVFQISGNRKRQSDRKQNFENAFLRNILLIQRKMPSSSLKKRKFQKNIINIKKCNLSVLDYQACLTILKIRRRKPTSENLSTSANVNSVFVNIRRKSVSSFAVVNWNFDFYTNVFEILWYWVTDKSWSLSESCLLLFYK